MNGTGNSVNSRSNFYGFAKNLWSSSNRPAFVSNKIQLASSCLLIGFTLHTVEEIEKGHANTTYELEK